MHEELIKISHRSVVGAKEGQMEEIKNQTRRSTNTLELGTPTGTYPHRSIIPYVEGTHHDSATEKKYEQLVVEVQSGSGKANTVVITDCKVKEAQKRKRTRGTHIVIWYGEQLQEQRQVKEEGRAPPLPIHLPSATTSGCQLIPPPKTIFKQPANEPSVPTSVSPVNQYTGSSTLAFNPLGVMVWLGDEQKFLAVTASTTLSFVDNQIVGLEPIVERRRAWEDSKTLSILRRVNVTFNHQSSIGNWRNTVN
ncbi:hypothetical protein EDD85DRAFT_974338 [Armillaria nabsnona]|nr:hypothetical protein EDD85DRAFT_974338 [Armillaria nabsnona]